MSCFLFSFCSLFFLFPSRDAHLRKCAELEEKRAAAQRLVGVAGNETKLAAAHGEVARAQTVVNQAKAELDEVSTRVLEEVERFKREKLADFKDVLLDYVQLQIDYNNRVRSCVLCALCVVGVSASRVHVDADCGMFFVVWLLRAA